MYDKEKFDSAMKIYKKVGDDIKKCFKDLQENEAKVAELKAVRDGDFIKIYVTNCSRIEMKLVEVREMILKFEEKLILEKMTDEEYTRFKKVVDSEWMRRKYNGNNN